MTYTGPAKLIEADGTEADVQITLTISSGSGLMEWRADGVVTTPGAFPMPGDATLRLPNGSEGKVLVRNSALDTSRDGVAIRLAGSGEPPSTT